MAKAEKKEKFHSRASEEIHKLLNEVVEKYHASLSDSEFLVLMKHGGWKSKGKTVFAKPKVLGDDLRSTWGKDVILYLNADMWSILSQPQKKYVLDHALYSLDLKYDRHDNEKLAPDGRPLLTTVPPDIEGFASVIRRHGVIMEDVKRLAKALTETNQLTIDDVQPAADGEKPASLPEPREGVRGTINPDGTIDLEDENQVTLDEVVAEADGVEPEYDEEYGNGEDDFTVPDDSDELEE